MRRSIRHVIVGVLTAATLAVASVAATAPAEAHGFHGGGSFHGGFGGFHGGFGGRHFGGGFGGRRFGGGFHGGGYYGGGYYGSYCDPYWQYVNPLMCM